MEINEWVRAARKHKGWNQTQLGDAVGRTKANIGHWETGKHSPSYEQVVQISHVTGFPMLPKGAATSASPHQTMENANPPALAVVIQSITEGNAELAGAPRKIWPVRIRGAAKLGDDGYYEVTEGDGWVDSYSSNPDAYGLRVKGDSMHPAIRNGSVVVVEPCGQLIPTEYVAIALIDGKKMVKELVVVRPDEVVVESVNGNKRQTIARSNILQIDPVAAVVSPSKWRAEKFQ